MTRETFVYESMQELETFNSARPEGRRVKGQKHRNRVQRGLERGWDLKEQGKDMEAVAAGVRTAMFGNPLVMWFLSFIISNWGDDIIAWILKKLFPAQGHFWEGEQEAP